MDGRHYDMTRFLTLQLDDAFTQIGLYHFNAVLFQEGIHLTFLGEHRFGLDDFLHVGFPQDAQHNLVKLLGVFCPMNDAAVFLGICGKLVQIFIKMRHRMALDLRSLLAQLFPFCQAIGHIVALAAHAPERGIVPLRVCLVLQELFCCFTMSCTHNPAAKISTTCLNFIFRPCFLATPAICIRHEQSGPVTYSAPV